MPMDKSLYPDNWNDISQYIRFERAGGKCEVCGLEHGQMVIRSDDDPEHVLTMDSQANTYVNGEWTPPEDTGEFGDKWIKIILTTAHLDHDPSNNDESNLMAMCQLHHLRHDAQQHARNAAITRAENKHQARLDAGQLTLWD